MMNYVVILIELLSKTIVWRQSERMHLKFLTLYYNYSHIYDYCQGANYILSYNQKNYGSYIK